MSLHELTRDLHHACEAHQVGQRMVSGAITPQEWADWLWAMRCLHSVVDLEFPRHMNRVGPLSADLAALPGAFPSVTALRFAADLVEGFTVDAHPSRQMRGAFYVLHGAHCSGGRVLAPKMAKAGLPTLHTSYRDREAVRLELSMCREMSHLADQARATFACLLSVMDEIEERRA